MVLVVFLTISFGGVGWSKKERDLMAGGGAGGRVRCWPEVGITD